MDRSIGIVIKDRDYSSVRASHATVNDLTVTRIVSQSLETNQIGGSVDADQGLFDVLEVTNRLSLLPGAVLEGVVIPPLDLPAVLESIANANVTTGEILIGQAPEQFTKILVTAFNQSLLQSATDDSTFRNSIGAQATSAILQGLSGLGTVTSDRIVFSTGLNTFSVSPIFDIGRVILSETSPAGVRSVIDAQQASQTLNGIRNAGTVGANSLLFTTAANVFAHASITAFGRSLIAAANSSEASALIDVALEPLLDSIGQSGLSADQIIYGTGPATAATTSLTAFSRGLLAVTNASNWRTNLGAVANSGAVGGLAALSSVAADRLIYTTGIDVFASSSLTPYARGLLANSSASGFRSSLGLGTAAVANVPNVDPLLTTSSTSTLTNKTLTSTTNNISANRLRYSTGSVNIGSASAPATGQLLTATDMGGGNFVADWQEPALQGPGANVTISTIPVFSQADGKTLGTSGVIIDGNDDVSGVRNLVAVTLVGSLQTASQPDITTLTGLQDATISNALNMTPGATVNGQVYEDTLGSLSNSIWIQLQNIGGTTLTSQNWALLASFVDEASGNLNPVVGNLTASTLTVSGRIQGVVAPLLDTDAANKLYVDERSTGLQVTESATYATSAILPNTPTYTPGPVAPFTNSTLMASVALIQLVVDSQIVAVGELILVKDQSDSIQNGLYVCRRNGMGDQWVLERADELSETSEFSNGTYTFVSGGAVNAFSGFVISGLSPGFILNDPMTGSITYSLFSTSANVSAGNGLQNVGNTFSVVGVTNSVEVGPSGVSVSSGYIGGPNISQVGTVVQGAWQSSSPIDVAFGGTGSTTAAAARMALNSQESNITLDALSMLNVAAATDRLVYVVSPGVFALSALTGFGRTLLSNSSAIAARTTLGLGTIATENLPAGGLVTLDTSQTMSNKTIMSSPNIEASTFTDGTAVLSGGQLTNVGLLVTRQIQTLAVDMMTTQITILGDIISGVSTLGATTVNVTNVNAATLTATGAVEGASITDGTATLSNGSITGLTGGIVTAGSLQGTTVTDGVASLTGGTLTGLTGDLILASANAKVQADEITDGVARLTGGALIGLIGDLSTSGAVTGGTLTDGIATLSGGNFATTGSITSTLGAIRGNSLTDGTATLSGGNLTSTGDIVLTGGSATASSFQTSGITVGPTTISGLDSLTGLTTLASTNAQFSTLTVATGDSNMATVICTRLECEGVVSDMGTLLVPDLQADRIRLSGTSILDLNASTGLLRIGSVTFNGSTISNVGNLNFSGQLADEEGFFFGSGLLSLRSQFLGSGICTFRTGGFNPIAPRMVFEADNTTMDATPTSFEFGNDSGSGQVTRAWWEVTFDGTTRFFARDSSNVKREILELAVQASRTRATVDQFTAQDADIVNLTIIGTFSAANLNTSGTVTATGDITTMDTLAADSLLIDAGNALTTDSLLNRATSQYRWEVRSIRTTNVSDTSIFEGNVRFDREISTNSNGPFQFGPLSITSTLLDINSLASVQWGTTNARLTNQGGIVNITELTFSGSGDIDLGQSGAISAGSLMISGRLSDGALISASNEILGSTTVISASDTVPPYNINGLIVGGGAASTSLVMVPTGTTNAEATIWFPRTPGSTILTDGGFLQHTESSNTLTLGLLGTTLSLNSSLVTLSRALRLPTGTPVVSSTSDVDTGLGLGNSNASLVVNGTARVLATSTGGTVTGNLVVTSNSTTDTLTVQNNATVANSISCGSITSPTFDQSNFRMLNFVAYGRLASTTLSAGTDLNLLSSFSGWTTPTNYTFGGISVTRSVDATNNVNGSRINGLVPGTRYELYFNFYDAQPNSNGALICTLTVGNLPQGGSSSSTSSTTMVQTAFGDSTGIQFTLFRTFVADESTLTFNIDYNVSHEMRVNQMQVSIMLKTSSNQFGT